MDDTTKPQIDNSRGELKLDLAAGQSPREGFAGVDFYAPNATYKVNLFKFPYPWEDNSVDELHCSHFVEHLPARAVEPRDLVLGGSLRNARDAELAAAAVADYDKFVDKDFFFAFFDECYRILKPGGTMTVIVPALKTVRAFQDPTHRRFICHQTFLYLSEEWRKINKLDHYNVQCNFGINVQHTCDSTITVRAPEYQAHVFEHEWDRMVDLHAILKKV